MEDIAHRPRGSIRANVESEKDQDYMKEFRRVHPPKFTGETGPIAAKEWFLLITQNLDTFCICGGWDRITLAAYCFTERAAHRWREVVRTHNVEKIHVEISALCSMMSSSQLL